MNAIDLLKDDHDVVERLFQKVKASEESEHMKLFEQIKRELEMHTHIEETVFYPKMRDEGDEELKSLVLEGFQEHHEVKMFLREIPELAKDSEQFEPKLTVLMENVTHHIQEEEGQMFPMIKEQFDEYTLQMLGAEIEKEKKSLQKSSTAKSGR